MSEPEPAGRLALPAALLLTLIALAAGIPCSSVGTGSYPPATSPTTCRAWWFAGERRRGACPRPPPSPCPGRPAPLVRGSRGRPPGAAVGGGGRARLERRAAPPDPRGDGGRVGRARDCGPLGRDPRRRGGAQPLPAGDPAPWRIVGSRRWWRRSGRLRATGRDPQGGPRREGWPPWPAPWWACARGRRPTTPPSPAHPVLRPAPLADPGEAGGAGGRRLLLVAAPALGAIAATLLAEQGAVNAANAPGWSGGGPLPATDLLTFVRPGDYYFPTPRPWGILGFSTSTIWAPYDLRGWMEHRPGHVSRRRAAVGPVWGAHAGAGPGGGGAHLGLPSPRAALHDPSPFDLVHHPYRMVSLGMVLLGLLAALGAQPSGPPRGGAGPRGGRRDDAPVAGPWPLPHAPPIRRRGGSRQAPCWTGRRTRHETVGIRRPVAHGHPVPWGSTSSCPTRSRGTLW